MTLALAGTRLAMQTSARDPRGCSPWLAVEMGICGRSYASGRVEEVSNWGEVEDCEQVV